jgi:hypothetical protein
MDPDRLDTNDPAWRFGTAVEGNRIGLCCQGAISGLRHLPAIGGAVQLTGTSLWPSPADYDPIKTILPDSFLILTRPDGSVSRENVGWPGDEDGSWAGGIGNRLYAAIQGPGVYKVQFKAATMESPSITFTIVSESGDFAADPRLDYYEALRKARGAAERTIRSDASKHGYEPIFTLGRDEPDETWVVFMKKVNDGRREKAGHGIVAYNKVTGALRWVPIE